MKIPLSWLKDFVDINTDVNTLKNKLFSCGFEVEEIIYQGKDIDKVVACKILNIEKHPNADKLSICTVNAGKGYEKLQIITGAKNVNVGDFVPVALDGSSLPNGKKINAGELRGVMSYGMLCSGKELNITDSDYEGAEADGILILKDKYACGTDIKDVLSLNDVIFDIGVTANRPDCQSVLGIAREVSAIFNVKLKMPDISYKTTSKKTSDMLKINVHEKQLCKRYIGAAVTDIKITKSPDVIAKRLKSCGIRPINNIVDITNYVLLEIGQPMHAFDYALLSGGEINVRCAASGETFTALDDKQLKLSRENLLICDKEKPVALAGVIGGKNSGINESTKTIIFESANFARESVRKTSRALGVSTDSSKRFEKGTDNYICELAVKRALNLISAYNFGSVCGGYIDIINEKQTQRVIETKISKITDLLGIKIKPDNIAEILERLGFVVGREDPGAPDGVLKCAVPLYRNDIEDYADLAEEIIRMYGYDNIKSTLLKSASNTKGGIPQERRDIDKLKNILTAQGFYEAVNYSFTSKKASDKLGVFNENQIKLFNPLGEDLSVMRIELVSSMLNTVSLNLRRKNNSGRLFELANIYLADKLPLESLPKEQNTLCLGIFGDGEDFYTLKGVLEELLAQFSAQCTVHSAQLPFMHPYRCATLNSQLSTLNFGFFGEVKAEVSESFEIDKKVYIAQINYDILKTAFDKKTVYKALPKFPYIQRDLALIADANITCGDIISWIKESCCGRNAGRDDPGAPYSTLLKSVELFDVYEGAQIEKGKKSLAFSLKFGADDRTLKDEEAEKEITAVLKNLSGKGIEIRG